MHLLKKVPVFSALALVLVALAVNCGSEKSSEPDTTAPAAVADLEVQAAGCDTLILTWTAPGDDGSEGRAATYDLRRAAATITEADWASATPVDGEPTPKSAGGTETFPVSGLDPGGTYYFGMKTTDADGNESTLSNVCSRTVGEPVIAWVKDGVGADQDWSSLPATLSANWALADCADDYEYALGTTAGATNVLGWTVANTPPSVTRSDLTLADGQTYYFSVRGLNGALTGSPTSSDGVTVDLTAPASSVNTLPAEETTAIFTVSWTGVDATSGIANYDVQVRTGKEGGWGTWLTATTLTSSDFTGLNGRDYYFRSRARDNAGNTEAYPDEPDASTVVNLGGIPQVAWVRDGLFGDADWTNSTTSLSAEWAAATGGDSYEYAIGASAGGFDVVDWTSTGTATTVTRTGLSLEEGQTCYFSVRVTVGAAHGNAVSSDGITVDITLPTSSIDPLPPVTTTERFDLTWIGRDGLSGIRAYNIQYKDGDGEWGDIYGWNPSTSFIGFQAEDGHTYYFRSRAMDNAGNIEAFPDVPDAWTTVDLPAIPHIAWVHDGLGADEDWTNLGGFDNYVGLSANWAAAPGVDGYQYAIGTAPGDSDLYGWGMGPVVTDTFRSEGEPIYLEGPTYYFSVRGVIGSRHGDSTSSDGVRVDVTPPTSKVDSLPDRTHTLTFNVSWSGGDTLSGLSHYTIRVKDGSGAGVEYQDLVVATTLTSAEFTGEDGHTYYFVSFAADSVGNEEGDTGAADAWTTVECAYVFDRKWGSEGTGNGEFDEPTGATVDASGNVWVVELSNHRIQKFSPDGAYLAHVGSSGTGDGEMYRPTDVAVDDSGYVYVSENANHRIQKFSSTGTFEKKWGTFGTEEGKLHSPFAIDVDDSFYVYVADTGNRRVQKFTSKGVFVKAWGDSGSGAGQFSNPRGLAVDESGIVYVTDADNRTIQKFTSDGTRLGGWGCLGGADGCLNYPTAIAVDGAGYVYVADTSNHRIQKFTTGGDFVSKWGNYGTGDGEFHWPQGLAISDSGHVYTTEPSLNRVQKFRWSCP